MPRAVQRVNQNNFAVGKISDSNPINPVEGGLRTALNVDISLNGRVGRRLGLEVEDDFNFPYLTTPSNWYAGYTLSELQDLRISDHLWPEVNQDPAINFRVFRVGNDLFIYDESVSPLSNGSIERITIPSSLIVSGINSTQASSGTFSCSAGRGVLFCVGLYYNPFYISYDGANFTFNAITVNIRDYKGVDDGLAVDEHPTTLSDLHKYNLFNQGWPQYLVRDTDGALIQPHIHFFKQSTNIFNDTTTFPIPRKWPANSDIWFYALSQDGNLIKFNAPEIEDDYFGNTPAPKGAIIYNLLDPSGRATASGVDIGVDTVPTTRSHTCAFYAGRIWFQIGDKLLYCKLIESLDDVDIYHPEQDPTAEIGNEVLATDGGYISTTDIGTIYKLETIGKFLVVFSSNGIFTISGTETSFTADDQAKHVVSKIKLIGNETVVTSQSAMYFWSNEGIFQLNEDPATGFLVTNDITKGRIATDYAAIPALARENAKGVYDREGQKIYWSFSYHTTDITTDIRNKYTDVLVYDLILNAFWDYRYSNEGYLTASTDYPIVAGLFKSNGIANDTLTDNVIVSGGVAVLGYYSALTYTVDGGGAYNLGAWNSTITESMASGGMWDCVDTGSMLVASFHRTKSTISSGPGVSYTIYSTDGGQTWDEASTLSTSSSDNGGGIAYSSSLDRFVVCTDQRAYYTSPDSITSWTAGSNWTTSQQIDPLPGLWVEERSEFIFAGRSKTISGNNTILYSSDGITWSARGTVGGTAPYYNQLLYLDAPYSRLLRCGILTGSYLLDYSTDGGDTWTTPTLSSAFTNAIFGCMAYSPTLDRVVAHASSNKIVYSDDGGSTWTEITSAANVLAGYSMIWNDADEMFYLLQNANGDISYSPTGTAWAVFDSGVTASTNFSVINTTAQFSTTVVDNTADTVTVSTNIAASTDPKLYAYIFLPDSSSDYRMTLAQFTSRSFKDWAGLTSADITANTHYSASFPVAAQSAGDYSSVVEVLPQTLGEPSLQKGATYIHTYYDYIRNGYNSLSISDEYSS